MEEALECVAAQLQLGDVVRFNRGEYAHLALYIGRGKVIHLWSPTDDNFQVRVDTLRRVHLSVQQSDAALPVFFSRELDARMLADHALPALSGDEVVQRAKEKLGEVEYDYLHYNCEHFVTWARYGFGASPQVASHTNQVLASALLGAVVGGFAGLVVGGIFSLFLKRDALSASAAGVSTGSGAIGAMSAADVDDDDAALSGDDAEVAYSSASAIGSTDPSDSDSDSNVNGTTRAAERAQLWANLDTVRSSLTDGRSTELRTLNDWVETRRRHAAAASARRYSPARHAALATRLADDDLQCGICFSDLLRVRTVAFSCDHMTCGVCFDALRANTNGRKNCPYCRLEVVGTDEIHKSTKTRAKRMLQ